MAAYLHDILKRDDPLKEFKAWKTQYQCWGELRPTLTDHVSVCQYLHRYRGLEQTTDIRDIWGPGNCETAKQFYSEHMNFY